MVQIFDHPRHPVHLCFRVVEVRAEAEEGLAGAVVAQGGGDVVGGEMCGDVGQRALGVLYGGDAGGVDAVRIGAEEGEA